MVPFLVSADAFLCNPKYVQALLICLNAIEHNKVTLLADIDPALVSPFHPSLNDLFLPLSLYFWTECIWYGLVVRELNLESALVVCWVLNSVTTGLLSTRAGCAEIIVTCLASATVLLTWLLVCPCCNSHLFYDLRIAGGNLHRDENWIE